MILSKSSPFALCIVSGEARMGVMFKGKIQEENEIKRGGIKNALTTQNSHP